MAGGAMMGSSSQEQWKHGRSPGSRAGMDNLIPFKPGQSGNPGGRPKNTPSLSHALARILALSPAELEEFQPTNQAKVIALQRIKDAASVLNPATASAQLKATEMIINRVDGPVEKRVVIENIPEFQSRVKMLVAALRKVNENIHTNQCGEACVCLTDEQFTASLISAFPEQARPMVERELALLD